MEISTRSLAVSSDVSGFRSRGGILASSCALISAALFALPAGLLVSAPAAAQSDTPFITLPRFGSGDQPDVFLYFDHKNGSGYLVEGLRRAPTQLRTQRLPDNLFQQIGRAASQAAIHGELLVMPIFASRDSVRDALFVETSTGYVAYLDEFGKNDKLGTLVTVIGRPFGPLAAGDGNFVLLQRRDSSGKTDGAYLYHGPTGKAIYIAGLAKLSTDLKGSPPSSCRNSKAASAPPRSSMAAPPPATCLVDAASGKVSFLDLTGGAPERLTARATQLDLLTAFAADKLNPSLQRFVVEPLDEGGVTRAVLVIDVASGAVALIDNPLATPTLRILPQNVYNVLRPSAGDIPRTFSTVRNGLDGVWLIDSLSAMIVYIARPTVPAELRISAVAPRALSAGRVLSTSPPAKPIGSADPAPWRGEVMESLSVASTLPNSLSIWTG